MNIKLMQRVGVKMQVAILTAAIAVTGVAVVAPMIASAASMSACTFSGPLKMGSKSDSVMCLQKYLNGSGYQVAASGAGSPGQETTYFGGLTKKAVSAWQAAQGVSPAVGYFGPLSQAKYSSVVAAGGTTGGTTTGGTTTGGTTTGGTVSVPAGSGLTVAATADEPASTLAPSSATRVPFIKAQLTASSDGDVTVNSFTVQRTGLANDAAFDSIMLLDENGNQVGDSKTLSSDHKVLLTSPIVVKAGTSRTVTIAGTMISDETSYAGQVASLSLIAVDAGKSAVNGSLPLVSAGMTMNSTLSIGSVTMSIGSLDPGAANTKNVGTTGYYLASVKASVGSQEDVTFQKIRFNQAGSAAATDIANVVVSSGGKDYPAVVSSDGKYYTADFGSGLVFAKGATVEFSVKADLVSGSARTVDMDISKKSDIVVKGNVFGYNITVGGGSAGAASSGGFSSNQQPFFNAYVATINKGSLLLSSSNTVASSNIGVSVPDTTLGAFTYSVKGEPMQISSQTLNFNFTGSGTSSGITQVKLFDAAGNIVAGPKDPASGVVTWTDTWTAPVGDNVYTVKGKLDTTFASNDAVTVGINPNNMTIKGLVTGLSISGTPASTYVTANGQTVKTAAISLSVSPTPFSQNIVRGVNGFRMATIVFDAGQSGEDVRVTSVQLRDTLSVNTVGADINSCQLYDGATALNTGSDVQNPSVPSSTTNDITFSLTNNLIVPKGTSKPIDVKCNIASSASTGSTHSWGLASGATINATGAKTASSITAGVSVNAGNTMTVLGAGSFTVVKDASAPNGTIIVAGKTSVPMNVLKFHATNEAISITDLTLTYSSSTASTSDFLKVSLWDGATKLGDAVWAGTALNATSTLTSPFIIPKDGDKLMTLTADIVNIDVNASSTPGRLLAIDYNGVSSSSGIGQSSGLRLGAATNVNTQGASMQIMKTVPTLAKVSVPSTSLPQTNAVLYRFSVTADPAGPVALYKFTFLISSSSVNATSSNFNVYGYSDSNFSVAAYNSNPLNPARAIGCTGQSTFDSDTNCKADTTGSITASTSVASSSQVAFFFAPQTQLASTSEAITVPAGQTRYFELRGDIVLSGSGTGNSVTVAMANDGSRAVQNAGQAGQIGGVNTGVGPQRWLSNYGTGLLATAAEIAMQAGRNSFVWSPMSTTTTLTGATSTPDWANGYQVPGLPNTGMSSNVFSN